MDKLKNIPVCECNITGSTVREIGITAEDFYSQFDNDMGVNGASSYKSSRSSKDLEMLTTNDLIGVTMSALKGAIAKIEALETRIQILENAT